MNRVLRAALLAVALAALLAPAIANGANRRVSISNYRWSEPEVHIDQGEHVSWYWIGPDLMHSITGNSPNSIQWDSDPQTFLPHHKLGDTYQVTFNQPGVYQFHCKLHSTVKGEIVVSADPGDPVDEPDPVPTNTASDSKPPHLSGVSTRKSRFGRKGTVLRFTLNEASRLDADFYRYDEKGKRKFSGWSDFRGHIGYNSRLFAKPSKHFKPRPGSYVALIRATDSARNASRAQRVRFKIR
jgi:plastocyanin